MVRDLTGASAHERTQSKATALTPIEVRLCFLCVLLFKKLTCLSGMERLQIFEVLQERQSDLLAVRKTAHPSFLASSLVHFVSFVVQKSHGPIDFEAPYFDDDDDDDDDEDLSRRSPKTKPDDDEDVRSVQQGDQMPRSAV
ncbi:MAG: hypothetical protein GY906_10830 [bacterium]|nr:hypothetical protein [bacterium]